MKTERKRGWLNSKTYADGNGPSYQYTYAGRLSQRTWARGTNTTYTYDGAGGLSTVSYNDGVTPGLTYSYDRRGCQTGVTQTYPDTSTAACALVYNDAGQVLSEAYTGGPLDGITISNRYDTLLRRTNLLTLKSGVLTSNLYGYDGFSRLLTVSDGTNAATYGYLTNSPLVGQITFTQSGATRMTTTKAYDYLNRLTGVSSSNATPAVLDAHGYAYNSANQRTSVTNADGSYWVYQYDALGQVTGGAKHWSDGSAAAGQQFGYGFDDIGNRKTTTAGGDQWGNYPRTASYSANDLNQYTSRTVPGAVDVTGSTTNTATVTVNNQATSRHGNYYRAQLPLNNTASAVWQSLTNLAVLNEGTNMDYGATNTGNVFLPQTPESFTYDADGNLASDGRWTYTWDGENRLLSLTSLTGAPAASKLSLNFVYDAKGRRIQKTVSTWNGSTYASPTTVKFVYDGWNLAAILNSSSALFESFTWGLDLSGSIQGAGGVGGLLGLNYYGSSTTNCFVAFDGNGNVSALVNAASGSVLAQYEYGPFGEVIRASGPMAKVNPFRFSTKYQDDESDFLYYGYRYMNASTGRWLSRDPIAEHGGVNIYSSCYNNPLDTWDSVGLLTVDSENPCCICYVSYLLKTGQDAALRDKLSANVTFIGAATSASTVQIENDIILLGRRGGKLGFAMLARTACGSPITMSINYDKHASLREITSKNEILDIDPDSPWYTWLFNPEDQDFLGHFPESGAISLAHEFGHLYMNIDDPFNVYVDENVIRKAFGVPARTRYDRREQDSPQLRADHLGLIWEHGELFGATEVTAHAWYSAYFAAQGVRNKFESDWGDANCPSGDFGP